jgi:alpha-methylacyl-CoA racemase
VSAGPPRQPLEGVTVIHLASLGPGPYGAMLLADLGADVIVVDRVPELGASVPAGLDPRRRGQRSVAVNLRDPRGTGIVLDLVRSADVLIEGMRPGAAERLGVGPEDCGAVNPALVYARMTGWGQEGPAAQTAGHDINYIAATGALHAMGHPDAPPSVPLNLLGDYAGGGAFLAFSVLAAVLDRARTGQGAVIDVAIVDGVTSLTAATLGMLHAGQWGERGASAFDGSRPWYRTYETRDGGYMAVGALETKFYRAFLGVMGLDPAAWERDERLDLPALTRELEHRFLRADRSAWIERFRHVDACVSPVLSFAEAMGSPAATARQAYIPVGGVTQPAPLPRWDGAAPVQPSPPPVGGQDTVAILRAIGRTDAEIADLAAAGCVTISGGLLGARA